MMRKDIDAVPGEFDGQEILRPCLFQELGERCTVAKDIWQPEHLGIGAELFSEEPFTVEKLTRQGFSAGHVGIWLDPHSSLGFPATLSNLHLDFLIHLWIGVFHPLIELWLAGTKDVIRITLHQRQDGCKATCSLADSFAQWPEP